MIFKNYQMTHSPSPGPPGVSRCALREMKNQFKDEILFDDQEDLDHNHIYIVMMMMIAKNNDNEKSSFTAFT